MKTASELATAIWVRFGRFRTLLEVGRTYGWRKGELLHMRVTEVDLLVRTLRLEPGTTKNKDGREVTMTDAVYMLLCECVARKQPDDFVFTREDATPEGLSQDLVESVRSSWNRKDDLRPLFTAGLDDKMRDL